MSGKIYLFKSQSFIEKQHIVFVFICIIYIIILVSNYHILKNKLNK